MRRILKWSGRSWARTLPSTRRKGMEEGEEVAHVPQPHALVGGVGEGRIVMAAAGRGALPHGADETPLAPAADAVVAVRRDVGGIKRAERRFQGKPAAE